MTTITFSRQFTGPALEDARQVAEWAVLAASGAMVSEGATGEGLTRLERTVGIHERLSDHGNPTPPLWDLTTAQLGALRAETEYLVDLWHEDGNMHEPGARPFYAERVATCRRVLALLDAE